MYCIQNDSHKYKTIRQQMNRQLNQFDQQQSIEIEKKRYQFVSDARDPRTVVMLKQLSQLDILGSLKKSQKSQQFPNFCFRDEPEKQKRFKRPFLAMLNTNSVNQNKQKMIFQFIRLVQQAYPHFETKIDIFQEKWLASVPTTQESLKEEVLKEYTAENFFYRAINWVLRQSEDPTETFYAQYFTQLLYRAVSTYRNDTNMLGRRFQCYRGGRFSEKEIQSLQQHLGDNIETLGFLSTSQCKLIALSFSRNMIMKISVDLENRKDNLGFASVININYPQEKQVIFLPFSIFRVQNIYFNQDLDIEVIELKYIFPDDVLNGSDDKLRPLKLDEKIKHAQYQLEIMSEFPELQRQQIALNKKILEQWKKLPPDSPLINEQYLYVSLYQKRLLWNLQKIDNLSIQDFGLMEELSNQSFLTLSAKFSDPMMQSLGEVESQFSQVVDCIRENSSERGIGILQNLRGDLKSIEEKNSSIYQDEMWMLKMMTNILQIYLNIEKARRCSNQHNLISQEEFKLKHLLLAIQGKFGYEHLFNRNIFVLKTLIQELNTAQTDTYLKECIYSRKSRLFCSFLDPSASGIHSFYQQISQLFSKCRYEQAVDILRKQLTSNKKAGGSLWERDYEDMYLVFFYNEIIRLSKTDQRKYFNLLQACRMIKKQESQRMHTITTQIFKKLDAQQQLKQNADRFICKIEIDNFMQFAQLVSQSLDLLNFTDIRVWADSFLDEIQGHEFYPGNLLSLSINILVLNINGMYQQAKIKQSSLLQQIKDSAFREIFEQHLKAQRK